MLNSQPFLFLALAEKCIWHGLSSFSVRCHVSRVRPKNHCTATAKQTVAKMIPASARKHRAATMVTANLALLRSSQIKRRRKWSLARKHANFAILWWSFGKGFANHAGGHAAVTQMAKHAIGSTRTQMPRDVLVAYRPSPQRPRSRCV